MRHISVLPVTQHRQPQSVVVRLPRSCHLRVAPPWSTTRGSLASSFELLQSLLDAAPASGVRCLREEARPSGYEAGVGLTTAADLLASPFVQARVTSVRAHRPWAMPERPWVMAQTWKDLLFAHWSVDPQALAGVVPGELSLDTFDGEAWIAVTPFEVRNLRLRLTFPVPLLSTFPEINVRTYVICGGRPGIFFFSLDAGSALAVRAARLGYRLPYFATDMSIVREGARVRCHAERTSPEAPDRAVLPVHAGRATARAACRYPPSAVAAAARRSAHRAQHDDSGDRAGARG
jgi:uncharacterized protein YqjF (DUF2071 family)